MSYAPTGFQVDIEFTGGVWTNVTSLVRSTAGVSIKFGRTSPTGTPQVATCSFTLDNASGNFTAFNAGSTYYPNVVPGKRVRVSYNSGSSPRFVGYIKSWQPSLDGGVAPVVTVSAVDRFEALGRSNLSSALTYESLTAVAGSGGYWPMADAVAPFDNAVTNGAPMIQTSGPSSWLFQTAPLIYGNTDTGLLDGGAGIAFTTPAASSLDAWAVHFASPAIPATTNTAFSMWAWLSISPGYLSGSQLTITLPSTGTQGPSISWPIGSATVAGITFYSLAGPTLGAGAHLFGITWDNANANFYIDGALVSTAGDINGTLTGTMWLQLAVAAGSPAGTVSMAGFGVTHATLSAGTMATIYAAGATGFSGEASGARAARILGYAGLTGTDYNLATGVAPMGLALSANKSIVTVLGEVVETESGGSVAYVDTDGRIRFNDRTFRSPGAPVITIDAGLDIDPGSWSPFIDDIARINASTVTRLGGGAVTYTDGSPTPITDSASSYANSDEDIGNIATWRVVSSASPIRFPQLSVNFARVSNYSTLFTALASVTIGSLLRVTNIPALRNNASGTPTRIFHTTQLDAYVEGWSETISDDNYIVTFDLSPFQPRLQLETGAVGRLVETPGTLVLTSAITNAMTSFGVTTTGGGPTLSTTAGDYSPTALLLKIDDEIVAVTAAPASSATPQTITVTRGANGTFADAHASSAVVSVYTGTLVL